MNEEPPSNIYQVSTGVLYSAVCYLVPGIKVRISPIIPYQVRGYVPVLIVRMCCTLYISFPDLNTLVLGMFSLCFQKLLLYCCTAAARVQKTC